MKFGILSWVRWRAKQLWWRFNGRCKECGGEMKTVWVGVPGTYWRERCQKCGCAWYILFA